MNLEWTIILILIVIILILAERLLVIRLLLRAMVKDLEWILSEDTNQGFRLPYREKRVVQLASEIEKDLRKLRRERLKYEKENAKLQNAVTNISHDLRTPLTAIMGYTELLMEKEHSEEEEQYLSIIRKRCEHLRTLMEELFSYSVAVNREEMEKPVLQEVDLKEVLAQSLADFYPELTKKGITPEISMPEGKVCAMLERGTLLRVFANLLSNVLKYSDGDLVIHLSDEGEIRFENHAAKLDKVQVEHLFDRFYTLESSRESTGLGLSVAKLLVERMDGRINAVYEDGRLRIDIRFNAIEKKSS